MNSKIIHNFFSLSSGELISKIIGLITFAYLARVLTPEGFGIIGFVTAFVSYFVLIVNFGFDTYGVREISRRGDKFENIVNSILTIRIILAILLFTLLVFTSFITGKNSLTRLALMFAGINLFTTAFSMDWFYQGIQKMHLIALRQVGTSILSLFFVILFVKRSDSILQAIFFSGISALINSLLLLRNYRKYFRPIRVAFSLHTLKPVIIESAPIALSSMMIIIYYNLDMVMLGFIKGNYEVGIYSSVVKIFLLGNIGYTIIAKSFFPAISSNGYNDSPKTNLVNFTFFLFMIAAGILTSSCMFYFGKLFIKTLFGMNYLVGSNALMILSMNSLIVCANIIFSNYLLAQGKNKEFLLVVITGAFTNVILNFYLIPRYSINGAALATLLSEGIVFIFLLLVYSKFTLNNSIK